MVAITHVTRGDFLFIFFLCSFVYPLKVAGLGSAFLKHFTSVEFLQNRDYSWGAICIRNKNPSRVFYVVTDGRNHIDHNK